MNWRPWAVVGAVLLAMSVSYFVGRKSQAIADKLSTNKIQIHASDSVTRIDSAKVDSAKKSSDILTTYRERVRERVVVRHDTIVDVLEGNEIIDKEVAQLISVDDSTISALKNTVALQDSLISALHVGLNLREARIALLEKPNSKTSRFITAAKWLTTGVVVGLAVAHR